MALLKIEWWNSSDLGDILYQTGYKNKIYLDVELQKPDYNVTIESDVDGENHENPKFRKWEKAFKIEVWAQEDLLDAFTLMQIHDHIEVTPAGGETIIVDQMRVTPEWLDDGCLAKATLTFTEDYVIKGACEDNLEADCLCSGTPSTFTQLQQASTLSSGSDGEIRLGWLTEEIAGKKYTAHLYQCSTDGATTWIQLPDPDPTCYLDTNTSNYYLFDGTYWYLHPGYLTSLEWSGAGELTIKAWIPPGTFGTIHYRTPAGIGVWTLLEDYHSREELEVGVIKTGCVSQSYDVKIKVLNHGCDYDYTELMTIAAP